MIYKYFRVNEYSISSLINNELFCQNYQSFNDPFECWFSLLEGIPDPQKEPERFESICKSWGFNSESDVNLQDYYTYMEELETYQPDISEYIRGAKISCFSTEIDNLLMWSHYADGMRGFCLEFDENQILNENQKEFINIMAVSYVTEPPIIDKMLFALAKDQIWYHEMALEEQPSQEEKKAYIKALFEAEELVSELYRKTIATKPLEWEYEKEVRLIFYSSSHIGEFFQYPFESIKSIIFGEKMDDKVKETLSRVIEMKNVKITQRLAKRKSQSYKIEFQTLK